ncbi:MAG: hypothetical protein LWY06_00470 [Firmicutes bacterium]|nr:hypothetical protein [Bacillota bacterium]
MDKDFVLNELNGILSGIIDSRDAFEKIAIILKIIPLESFEETFRYFPKRDQEQILEAMDIPIKLNAIDTVMIVREFVDKSDLTRFLKLKTNMPDEIVSSFQKYAGEHPRKISELLRSTWLKKKGKQ